MGSPLSHCCDLGSARTMMTWRQSPGAVLPPFLKRRTGGGLESRWVQLALKREAVFPGECAPNTGCPAQPEDMAKRAAASVIRDTVRASSIDAVRVPAMDAAVNERRENWPSFLVQWDLVYDAVELEKVLDWLCCSKEITPWLLTHSAQRWSFMRPMMTQKGLQPWFHQVMEQRFCRMCHTVASSPNWAWASLITVINAA